MARIFLTDRWSRMNVLLKTTVWLEILVGHVTMESGIQLFQFAKVSVLKYTYFSVS